MEIFWLFVSLQANSLYIFIFYMQKILEYKWLWFTFKIKYQTAPDQKVLQYDKKKSSLYCNTSELGIVQHK